MSISNFPQDTNSLRDTNFPQEYKLRNQDLLEDLNSIQDSNSQLKSHLDNFTKISQNQLQKITAQDKKILELTKKVKQLKIENNTLETKISNMRNLHNVQLKKRILDNTSSMENKREKERYKKCENRNVYYEKVLYALGEKFSFNADMFLDINEIYLCDDFKMKSIIDSIKETFKEELEGL